MASIEKQLSTIKACRTLAELRRQLHRCVEDCGFSGFALGDLTGPVTESIPFLTSYDPKWWNIYFAEKFFNFDPTLAVGKRTNFPFTWRSMTLPKSIGKPKPGPVRVMEAVREFGVAEGLAVPIHHRDPLGGIDYGVCGLFWEDDVRSFDASVKTNQTQLHMIVLYAFDKFVMLHAKQHPEAARALRQRESVALVNLTDRELEVLKWAAVGKTADETAEILNCSRRTVETHITNATRKLGALTKTQATVLALSAGLITI